MTREFEFDEEQEELDFVQPHKKISVTLTVSGYDRLIDLANAIENDDTGYWTNKRISSVLKNISSNKLQPCEDVISRQAVLDTMSELNAISFYEAQEDSRECYYEIKQAVENMQSITIQPKIGHWIKHEIEDTLRWIECSNCHYETYNIKHNYCSNCGAKMENKKE